MFCRSAGILPRRRKGSGKQAERPMYSAISRDGCDPSGRSFASAENVFPSAFPPRYTPPMNTPLPPAEQTAATKEFAESSRRNSPATSAPIRQSDGTPLTPFQRTRLDRGMRHLGNH